MRRAALAALTALALAGCGGADEEATPTDLPTVKRNAAGIATAPVADPATAKRLCDAAQAEWPKAWADYPYVTFDLPGTPSDYSCVRPG